MKIVHLLSSESFSGAENVAITIIDELKQEFDMCYVSPDGPIRDVLESHEIEFKPIKNMSLRNVKNAISEIKPDIIHAHDYRAGILSALCFPKARIINHLHNNSPWIKKYNLYSISYLCASLRFWRILTVSNSIEDEYIFGNYIHGKVQCVGNPVNVDMIRKRAGNYANAGHAADRFTNINNQIDVAYLGRLTPQKNPELLSEIIIALATIKPDITVAIIGGGEQYRSTKYALRHQIEQGNVFMLGFVENPYSIIKNAKCLILPSKWEGFGLAAIEALSLGVPVVCSGAGGLKDIVDDACGRICDFSIDAYVDEVIKLVTDERYHEKKSQSAYQKANSLNNIDEYIEIIKKLYLDARKQKESR